MVGELCGWGNESGKEGREANDVYAKINVKRGRVLNRNMTCSVSHFTKSLWANMGDRLGQVKIGG